MVEHRENFIADGRYLKYHNKVMDSQINYYNKDNPRIPYGYKELFLDNGAYSALRRRLKLDPERVKRVQEVLNPDKTIPLDFPFRPGSSAKLMAKRWSKTKTNVIDWQETTRLRELVPALHAWSSRSLTEHVRWLQRNANASSVAIGSVVLASVFDFNATFGDRYPTTSYIDMLLQAVREIHLESDFSIHMMGFGASPLMLHIGYFCGIDSMDSAGYRRGAAYGKIILPGKGWRYVGKLKESFRIPNLTKQDKLLLYNCKCPVCKQDHDLVRRNWKARAIHNKYVLEKERDIAKHLLEHGRDKYERHLDHVFEHSWLRAIWRYTKSQMRFLRVDRLI
jgi:7-cyano-7-deazaguanine tRNA-ribosyltransferase